MVGERRTDLRGPTSTLDIGKYDNLIFSVMLWEYPFCLLGNDDRGERNFHATFHDETEHIYWILKIQFVSFCHNLTTKQFFKSSTYRAEGTLYMVQKLIYVLSISEGEIWSRTDKKRSRTDENYLSVVAAP